MTTGDGRVLRLERRLPVPQATVYDALTEADQLGQWWGPRGFTTPSVDFDPRVGDRYRIAMQPPDGDLFNLLGEFRKVDPPAGLTSPSDGNRRTRTTGRHSSPSRSSISATRPRSASPRASSRRRSATRCTRLAGRRASIGSTSSCATRRDRRGTRQF
jgi:Activator of Hsp90 ATPase homolog 1-like protein